MGGGEGKMFLKVSSTEAGGLRMGLRPNRHAIQGEMHVIYLT
jgi:hypothetical protein